jgi:hypothetical protein
MPLKPAKHIKVNGLNVVIECTGLAQLREAVTELRIKKRECRLLERDAMNRWYWALQNAPLRAERKAIEKAEAAELAGIRHFLTQFTLLIPQVQALILREPPEWPAAD